MDRALATRHVMQANKSKDTGPELLVRSALREAGYPGYRLHWKKAAGHPDICYPGRKIAIFVNGCFWHRCPYCTGSMPKTNVAFWEAKFARNRARDVRDHEALCAEGWEVIVIWECRLKRDRRQKTLRELVERVSARRSGARGEGLVVELGAPSALKLARAHERLAHGTHKKSHYHR